MKNVRLFNKNKQMMKFLEEDLGFLTNDDNSRIILG